MSERHGRRLGDGGELPIKPQKTSRAVERLMEIGMQRPRRRADDYELIKTIAVFGFVAFLCDFIASSNEAVRTAVRA